MAETENAQALERAVAAWNRGDLNVYLDLYDADVVLHGLPRGIAGVRSMYEGVWRAYPNSSLTLDDVIVQGEKLACRYTWRATDPKTNEPFVTPGVTIMHFAAGKCRERWDFEGGEANVA